MGNPTAKGLKSQDFLQTRDKRKACSCKENKEKVLAIPLAFKGEHSQDDSEDLADESMAMIIRIVDKLLCLL